MSLNFIELHSTSFSIKIYYLWPNSTLFKLYKTVIANILNLTNQKKSLPTWEQLGKWLKFIDQYLLQNL